MQLVLGKHAIQLVEAGAHRYPKRVTSGSNHPASLGHESDNWLIVDQLSQDTLSFPAVLKPHHLPLSPKAKTPVSGQR